MYFYSAAKFMKECYSSIVQKRENCCKYYSKYMMWSNTKTPLKLITPMSSK